MIHYIYNVGEYNVVREKVITNVINICKEHLKLPEDIEIEFVYLSESVYAQTIVTHRFKNRLQVNNSLSAKEVIKPVIHELIHLEQMHTGKLYSNGKGVCVYEGIRYNITSDIPNYTDYVKYPWELDAMSREPKMLQIVLEKMA
jgi:hypothetical protein